MDIYTAHLHKKTDRELIWTDYKDRMTRDKWAKVLGEPRPRDPERYCQEVHIGQLISDWQMDIEEFNNFDWTVTVSNAQLDRLFSNAFEGDFSEIDGVQEYIDCDSDKRLQRSLQRQVGRKLDQDEVADIVREELGYHIALDKESWTIYFQFNKRSKLNRWLIHMYRHSKEYRGDAQFWIHMVLDAIADKMLKLLKAKDSRYTRYFDWIESGYCLKCEVHMFDDNGVCGDCGTELKYGEDIGTAIEEAEEARAHEERERDARAQKPIEMYELTDV